MCEAYWSNTNCATEDASLDKDIGVTKVYLNKHDFKSQAFVEFQSYGPETVSAGDFTTGYKYLFYITNYATTPVWDDGVNCIGTVYAPNNGGSVPVPVTGTEKFFLIGCFTTFEDFTFITSGNNVGTAPTTYPAECP